MTTLVRMRRSTPPCRFLKKTLLRVHHQEIVVKKTFIMICKGLFINDVITFGGYRDPPVPLVIIRHFLATPPHRARNSRQNGFRDKTAYVGFLTIVEGQPVTAMSLFFFWYITPNIQGVFLYWESQFGPPPTKERKNLLQMGV